MNAPLLIALLPAALAVACAAAYYWGLRLGALKADAAATRPIEPADLPPRPPRPPTTAATTPRTPRPSTWPAKPGRRTPRPPAVAKAAAARHPTWVGRARVAPAPTSTLVIDEAGRFWAAPAHASHDADALPPIWSAHWHSRPTPHEQRSSTRHAHMRQWEHAHDAFGR